MASKRQKKEARKAKTKTRIKVSPCSFHTLKKKKASTAMRWRLIRFLRFSWFKALAGLTLYVRRVMDINYLLSVCIHNQEKMLRELMKTDHIMENALIFIQILLTYSVRICMEISQENLKLQGLIFTWRNQTVLESI